jgi:hypothetical protein
VDCEDIQSSDLLKADLLAVLATAEAEPADVGA